MPQIIPLTDPVSTCDDLTGLLARRRSRRNYKKGVLTLPELSLLLFAAQGVNRKREQMRTVPSAGALFPIEIVFAAQRVENIDDGIYRYRPADHALQLINAGNYTSDIADAALQQDWIAKANLILIYSAFERRTTAKYGWRGHQYIHIEVGHAAQNVFLAAESVNLGSAVVGAFESRAIKRICQLRKNEKPLYLQTVGVIR